MSADKTKIVITLTLEVVLPTHLVSADEWVRSIRSVGSMLRPPLRILGFQETDREVVAVEALETDEL